METKRKFLFVSLTGLVGDIAWQVLKEGHEVRYFIGDPEEKDIADGFVPKTDDWEKDVDWADVIFVMEKMHLNKLRGRFRRYLDGKRVICLDIHDEYEFMDPVLVQLLQAKVGRYL